MSVSFGEFELDQEQRQLLRSGRPIPLEPKAYELLTLLVQRRPKALSRAQIRDVVWPRTCVSESTLTVVVNGIRHALADDARHPGLWRLPLDEPGAGQEEKVLDVGGEGRWSLRPDGILVLDSGLGLPPAIRFFEYATRRASEVVALPSHWSFVEYGGAFAVSPDGQWAIVTVEQLVESDIMLVEGFR